MNILCFDISPGGLSAAVVDGDLNASNVIEIPWKISVGAMAALSGPQTC